MPSPSPYTIIQGNTMENFLSRIEAAKGSMAEAAEGFKAATMQYEKVKAAYMELTGGSMDSDTKKKIMGLVKKYAPMAMTAMGFGGGGAMLGEMGGFSAIWEKVSGLFGGGGIPGI
jgi:hypothetical protein